MASYDPSRSNDMMRNIYRVSSQIAATPTPPGLIARSASTDVGSHTIFRRYRSDVPLDGFITPARRAPLQPLGPENKPQCNETSMPDKPSMDKPPSPESVAQCDNLDYVSDKMHPSHSSDMMRNIYGVSSQIAATPTPPGLIARSASTDVGSHTIFRRYRSDVPLDGFITPARRAPLQPLGPENKPQCNETSMPDKPSMDKPPSPESVAQCDNLDYVSDKMHPSHSSDMMRNIYSVSSQIAAVPTPIGLIARPASTDVANRTIFRRYRSDVPLDGFITPARRRALLQTIPSLDIQSLGPENKLQCASETSMPEPSMDKPPSPDSVAQSDTLITVDYVSDKMQQSQLIDERADQAYKSQSQLASDAERKQKQINRVFMNLKIAEKVKFNFNTRYYECMHASI